MSVVHVMIVEFVLTGVELTLEICGVPEGGRFIATLQVLFKRLSACLYPSADGYPLAPPCNNTCPLLPPATSSAFKIESTTVVGKLSAWASTSFSLEEHPETSRFVRFRFS